MITRTVFDYTKQDRGICIVFSFSKALSAITNNATKYDAILEEICKKMEPLITVPFIRTNINGKPISAYSLQERIEILSIMVRASKGSPFSGFDINNTFLINDIYPQLQTVMALTNIKVVKHDKPDFNSLIGADLLYSISFAHRGGWHEVVCGYDTDHYIVDPNYNHPFSLIELENRYGQLQYGDCLQFSTQ